VVLIPMASNGKPQFLKHVFSQQSNGAVIEKVQRFGGQDKTALRAVAHPPARLNRAKTPRDRIY
jgi:hypothetical protein